MVPGLFLTTVTHFEHFLGPRCRFGARPELGPSLVPFWTHLRTTLDHLGSSSAPNWFRIKDLGSGLVWDPGYGLVRDPRLGWSGTGLIWDLARSRIQDLGRSLLAIHPKMKLGCRHGRCPGTLFWLPLGFPVRAPV